MPIDPSAPIGVFTIYRCPHILRRGGQPCGYVRNFGGKCPFDHGKCVDLVPVRVRAVDDVDYEDDDGMATESEWPSLSSLVSTRRVIGALKLLALSAFWYWILYVGHLP